MANMSYCQFQNTLNDLRDCFDRLDEAREDGIGLEEFASKLSEDERWAMYRMVEWCVDFAQVANEMENI